MKKRYLFTGLLFGGSFAGYKFLKNSAELDAKLYPKEKKVYEFESDYTQITIGETVLPIYIKKSEDDKVRIICFEGEKDFYQFIDDGDELIVVPRNDRSGAEQVQNVLGEDKGYLELQIPERLLVDLYVYNRSSNITVEDCEFKSAHIRNINSTAVVSGLNVKEELVIVSRNGVINLDGSKAKKIKIESENGTIIVFEIEAYLELELTSKNGIISGYDLNSAGLLIVENRNGDIELQGIDFDTIGEFVNRDGRTDIRFAGSSKDYAIEVITEEKSSVEVPFSEGNKPIIIETRYGDVKVTLDE